jgi:GT2 family glycosyltransferase
MAKPQLSIIMVNYNTKDDCIKCIQSIREKITGITYEVIVCDNGSADGSIDAIKRQFPSEKFPWVYVIDIKDNIGFGRANNVGAMQAKADVLLFLNPDTLIDHGIDKMYSYLSGHKDTGVLGPVVIDRDNRINLFYPPVYSNMFLQIIDLILTPAARLSMTWKKFIYSRYIGQKRTFDTGCIIGCAMMFRKDAYTHVRGFDERVFMFGEEFDICRRLRENGYRVQVFPGARIVHYGGHSTQKTPSVVMMTIGAQSLKILLKKHFPGSWRVRYIIEALTHIRQIVSASLNTAVDSLTAKDRHAHAAAIQRHMKQLKVMCKVLREKDDE